MTTSPFTEREVREAGWPSATFRARIERRTKRGKEQWRFVVVRHFVHTHVHKRSRWRDDFDKTVTLANRWLNQHDHDYEENHARIDGYV